MSSADRGRRQPECRRRHVIAAAVAAAVFLAAAGLAVAAPPANVSVPTVVGTFRSGETLTAAPGFWSGTEPITYGYRWQRCPSYKTAVLQDSPRAYWRLGEADGTGAADSSGNGNGATYRNSPSPRSRARSRVTRTQPRASTVPRATPTSRARSRPARSR